MAVELEAADICLLILCLLAHTLLELALLLETVLLRHLALLALSLHDTALRAELLHLAVEHHVLAELALQTSVIYRNLDRWLQSNLLEALLAVAQYPSLVACEGTLESLADHLVGVQQVRGRDALAVWRVHHDDALLGRLCEVLEILLGDGDILAQTGCTHVEVGSVHRLHIYIISVDVVLELALLRVVVIDHIEEILVEIVPLLEGKLLAEYTWRDVACDEGSLDGDGSRTAHWVDEVAFALPAGHQDHTCSEYLVQRCLYLLLTVAAAVQTLTA